MNKTVSCPALVIMFLITMHLLLAVLCCVMLKVHKVKPMILLSVFVKKK